MGSPLEFLDLKNTTAFTFDGRDVRARVVDVYDGDTLTCVLEVFPGAFHQIKVRLKGIDTPEMRKKPGQTAVEARAEKLAAVAARNRVIELVTNGEVPSSVKSRRDVQGLLESRCCLVDVRCSDFDKYGRVLGVVVTSDAGTNINDALTIRTTDAIRDTTRRAYLADLNTISKYCGSGSGSTGSTGSTGSGSTGSTGSGSTGSGSTGSGSNCSGSSIGDIAQVVLDPGTWYPVISKCAFEQRKVKRKSATGTRRTLVKTILAVLKHTGLKKSDPDLFNRWHAIFQKLTQEVDDLGDVNTQSESSMTWAAVLRCAESCEPGTLEHATMALYTLIPPRRQHDYWKLRVRGEVREGDTASLDVATKTLSVFIFKTGDKYGEFKKVVPDALLDAVRIYVERRAFESDYLFCKQDGAPYASLFSFTSANNATIKRRCKNPAVSVNTLRHAAASHVHGNSAMLRKDKKQYAYDMGHSFHMQSMYVEVEREEE
ncbi:hypothetical protein FOA52_004167 [Chlamydomonas sp. UWO 241]|nr:hypothetical protein FOA52_004167 [Chlamydomonas sp. UWO 241]